MSPESGTSDIFRKTYKFKNILHFEKFEKHNNDQFYQKERTVSHNIFWDKISKRRIENGLSFFFNPLRSFPPAFQLFNLFLKTSGLSNVPFLQKDNHFHHKMAFLARIVERDEL